MFLPRIFLVASSIVFLAAACSKSDTKKSLTDDDCFVGTTSAQGKLIDGQYIIAYRANSVSVSEPTVTSWTQTLLKKYGLGSSAVKETYSGRQNGFIARLTKKQADEIKNDPSVVAVEQDRIISLAKCFTVVEPRLITWNISRVGYGDGSGKTAWIIDSGIDFDHPDLNVDLNRSKSFISGQTSAEDENGHGTHVAGIIGAKNNTIGVLGVASGAKVVSLRVLNKDGEGTLSSIIQALAYINSNAKAGDVVNMSLGEDDTPSEILDQAVQNTANRGILFSIAAGNDHKPAIQFSPGRTNGSNIFTVSAVDSLDNFANFSNFGNEAVDFAAPGVAILSTFTEGRYAKMSGTSMAAPHLAGLLLLNGTKINTSGTALNDPDGMADPIAHK